MQFSNTNPASATGCQAVLAACSSPSSGPRGLVTLALAHRLRSRGLGQVAPGKADPRRSSTDAIVEDRMFFQGALGTPDTCL